MNVKFGDLVSQYDGASDFTEWSDKFELVVKLQGLDEVEKIIPLFLTGGAFLVFKGMDDDAKKDYNKIKSTLQRAFSMDAIGSYEKLRELSLRSGSSVDVYLAEIKKLAHSIDDKVMP